jgi:flagellar hook-associated protein 3 FlgL
MIVTENSTYRLMQTNLERITTKLQHLQNQGSTGLKLNAPSDNPSVVGPVIDTRSQITNTNRYITTMGTLSDQLKSTDTYLGNIQTILDKAQTIANNAVNGSLSSNDLSSLANQVDQLKQQMIDTANASIGGQYIFAGYQVTTKPFTENPSYTAAGYNSTDPTTWPVIYNGDTNETKMEITPGETVQTDVTGNELFLGISNTDYAAGNYVQGTNQVDIFEVLTQTADAIRAGNVDDASGPGGGIENNITNLQNAATQADTYRSALGVQAARVDNANQQQQSVQSDLKQTLSNYQDADMVTTFANLSQIQTAYQAALKITSQVSSISILNYLQ